MNLCKPMRSMPCPQTPRPDHAFIILGELRTTSDNLECKLCEFAREWIVFHRDTIRADRRPRKSTLFYDTDACLGTLSHETFAIAIRWVRAISPALMTAFSTSSSSMTLPVTMRSVEERGKVSNKVTSFTLPLGATINMDGTALYECIGVIFLAQYYGSVDPEFALTMGQQVLIVVMALMASIGAAGIPSAGLVMMLTILSALGLPLEGAALLLAVDRPLDMMRTVVNVWSDSCGAAIIARTEGETAVLDAGSSA